MSADQLRNADDRVSSRVSPDSDGPAEPLTCDDTRENPLQQKICTRCGERPAGTGGVLCDVCFAEIGATL